MDSMASCIALVAFEFFLADKTGANSGLMAAGTILVTDVPSSWIVSYFFGCEEKGVESTDGVCFLCFFTFRAGCDLGRRLVDGSGKSGHEEGSHFKLWG